MTSLASEQPPGAISSDRWPPCRSNRAHLFASVPVVVACDLIDVGTVDSADINARNVGLNQMPEFLPFASPSERSGPSVQGVMAASLPLRSGCCASYHLRFFGSESVGAVVKRIRRLGWSELSQAPDGAGVYAWYYEPEITDFDLAVALDAIDERLSAGDRSGAEAVVESLLNENILSYFRQDAYEVVLSGPLKPRHLGRALHEQRVSSGLVERVVEDPQRLRHLRDVLAASAPHFASPIYIGMSDGLRTRLARHRALIEKFRAEDFRRDVGEDPSQPEEAGFARRIVRRRIPPDRLFVMICETSAVAGLHVDAENLLNRIYYPILGRN